MVMVSHQAIETLWQQGTGVTRNILKDEQNGKNAQGLVSKCQGKAFKDASGQHYQMFIGRVSKKAILRSV